MTSDTANTRAAFLDLFKTILTVGMIFAHVIQLADAMPGQVAHALSIYTNLITFSGFMFAFGMGVGLSRRTAPTGAMLSRCKTPAVLFLGYCISSLAQIKFLDAHSIGGKELTDILLMHRLYGYSEFLAGFFLLSLITSFARPLMFAVRDNLHWIAAFVALSVIFSALDLSVPKLPLVAAVVGSHDYPTFPLAQYLPWFLLGMRYTRPSVSISCAIWLTAAAATLAFLAYVAVHRALPSRFPPDTLWVAGPALFLLVYLSLCHTVAKRVTIPGWAVIPGRHVLLFLVVSNVVLFVAASEVGKLPMSLGGVLAYTLAIIVPLGAAVFICERIATAAWHRELVRS